MREWRIVGTTEGERKRGKDRFDYSLFGAAKITRRRQVFWQKVFSEIFLLSKQKEENRGGREGKLEAVKRAKRESMFSCVACTKRLGETQEEDGRVGSSSATSTKEAVKSLTAQIKDMAIKFSGANRQRQPYAGSGLYKKGHMPYSSFDVANSNKIPFPYYGGGSSTSTPTWNFITSNAKTSRVLSTQSDGNVDSISTRSCNVVLENDDEPKEWMAQVEPGVHITFMSLPNGGNDLRRIRFSREMFNKWQAQQWWGKNYDRIMELYNVQRFNRQALHTPTRSEDAMGLAMGNGPRGEPPSLNESRMTTLSQDDASVSISNASEIESEWVEEDEPGVYITVRQLADGTRELRRVRFSREKFGEVRAKQWWEENRERVQAEYL